MTQRPDISPRQGVDMSPQAIARRLDEAAELMLLGFSLADAKFVGRVRERRPNWGCRKVEED